MSKIVDTISIMQVIGSVYNNPSLLEKYTITENDFVEPFHKVVFGAIFKIYELGVEKINLKNIVDFLSDRPKSESIFNREKGEEWLQKASESADLEAFDYYYNRMKKMSLLRAFDSTGFDVTFLYDPDNIMDIKKKQMQEEWLDNNTLEVIAQKLSEKLDSVVAEYVGQSFGEVQRPFEGDLELKERLKQSPDVGVPLYGPLINTVTRGARLRKFYLGSAPSGYGKAIPNCVQIPTPDGFRFVGDIKPGDYLFSDKGFPTRVLEIHPQEEQKEVWNIHFEDGRIAHCCSEHLWQIKGVTRPLTTLQLRALLDGQQIFIPMTKPVFYPEKKHAVRPYFMGAMAGYEIPREYLIDSVKNRKELLIGICENKGVSRPGGAIEIIESLKGVDELCHSLGIKCFKLPEDKFLINFKESAYNRIRKIEHRKEKVDMTCFTVENPEHLFLMNDYIVTHNTRSMISHVCNIGCNEIYNETYGWIKNGTAEPVLYITTEQELEELQTMMWAFLSNVDEDHILNNKYEQDEEIRVDKAIEILKRSKIYIVELPDFSLRDVENIIKQNIRENGIKYVFFDYLMTSLKILEEISSRSGGIRLREDNVLFMMSRRLKDLANEFGVFVYSATQLNGDWKDTETPDQNLLRGAKSIADSIDVGYHILPVTRKDLEALQVILSSNTFDKPNMKMSFYKNRRGRYKGVYLWCNVNHGTCRFKPMFATTWDYEIISMEDLRIITDEKSAF